MVCDLKEVFHLYKPRVLGVLSSVVKLLRTIYGVGVCVCFPLFFTDFGRICFRIFFWFDGPPFSHRREIYFWRLRFSSLRGYFCILVPSLISRKFGSVSGGPLFFWYTNIKKLSKLSKKAARSLKKLQKTNSAEFENHCERSHSAAWASFLLQQNI